jgi:hypothetical protein
MDINNWEIKCKKSIKYNVQNLKEGTNTKEYRNKVEELLQVLPNIEGQHVEAAWEDMKQYVELRIIF